MSKPQIGAPVDRRDGLLKVTGAAKYTADLPIAGLAHAMMVQSTVAKGKIRALDTVAAEAVGGVYLVLTHGNALNLTLPGEKTGGMMGEKRMPLSDAAVHFNGQTIALVVADTFETARYAASLVKAAYDTEPAALAFDDAGAERYQPESRFGEPLQAARGDALGSMAQGAAIVDQTYTTPREHHNAMEPHATIAQWSGDQLTVYDSTQGVIGCQKLLAAAFKLKPEQVRVVSHFVGGGFGSKGSTWGHVFLAAMAARVVKKPVKLVVTRQQMFTNNGYRPMTAQHVKVSGGPDGQLLAIDFQVDSHTSINEEFIESAAFPVRSMYRCANVRIGQTLAKLNVAPPTFMRAPGEATGTFGIECALDELAHALRIDPLALRLRNLPDQGDPANAKPWSSYHLRECFEQGSRAFGWAGRPLAPGQLRDGRLLVGWGVAMATYPAHKSEAHARAEITADGRALVVSATQDIGTGTYTIMTQVAADALGLPLESVRFDLGDSDYPPAPVSGGSMTTASVAPAVREACAALVLKAAEIAVKDRHSALHGLSAAAITAVDGRLFAADRPEAFDTFAGILRRGQVKSLAAESKKSASHDAERKQEAQPAGPDCQREVEDSCYSHRSFGAQFAEVKVDPDTGEVRVSRFVGCFDGGRILNAKTARSQLLGGMIWAQGMALLEESVPDPKSGRLVTRNLADYRVPVHADIRHMEAYFIDEPDPHFTAVGARGIGEIGITGGAAAIANAVFHATGKRVRDLPISPEKVLART